MEKALSAVIDDTFLPNPKQRQSKSTFWAMYAENPLFSPDSISMEEAYRVTKIPSIKRWWNLPGFKDWFLNKDEYRQRLEYLAHLALDTAEEILLDRDTQASARVNMAKLIIEAANKMPNKYAKQQYLDETISKMEPKQLEEYISRMTQSFIEGPKGNDESNS